MIASQNPPRKRQIQAQTSNFSPVQPSPKIQKARPKRLGTWFLRRINILITLLRLSPYLLSFLCILCIGLLVIGFTLTRRHNINQSPGCHAFDRVLTEHIGRIHVDANILETFSERQLESFSGFRETSDGVILDTFLNGKSALVTIDFPIKITTPSDHLHSSHISTAPRLHRLSRLLNLQHSVSTAYGFPLPVILDSTRADRQTARSLLHASGFRSRSKVPQGAMLTAHVVILPPGLQPFPVLHMPAVEPYNWTVRLPTSEECGIATRNSRAEGEVTSIVSVCRALTEAMLVSYIGGCGSIENGALLRWSHPEKGTVMLGLPRNCFRTIQGDVSRDILMSYLAKTCELPKGIAGTLQEVHLMGWGVGMRAMHLITDINGLCVNDRFICGEKDWMFYDAPFHS